MCAFVCAVLMPVPMFLSVCHMRVYLCVCVSVYVCEFVYVCWCVLPISVTIADGNSDTSGLRSENVRALKTSAA